MVQAVSRARARERETAMDARQACAAGRVDQCHRRRAPRNTTKTIAESGARYGGIVSRFPTAFGFGTCVAIIAEVRTNNVSPVVSPSGSTMFF